MKAHVDTQNGYLHWDKGGLSQEARNTPEQAIPLEHIAAAEVHKTIMGSVLMLRFVEQGPLVRDPGNAPNDLWAVTFRSKTKAQALADEINAAVAPLAGVQRRDWQPPQQTYFGARSEAKALKKIPGLQSFSNACLDRGWIVWNNRAYSAYGAQADVDLSGANSGDAARFMSTKSILGSSAAAFEAKATRRTSGFIYVKIRLADGRLLAIPGEPTEQAEAFQFASAIGAVQGG